jgi:hypothetical protein
LKFSNRVRGKEGVEERKGGKPGVSRRREGETEGRREGEKEGRRREGMWREGGSTIHG